MIVACPSCSARFKVADEKIGLAGRQAPLLQVPEGLHRPARRPGGRAPGRHAAAGPRGPPRSTSTSSRPRRPAPPPFGALRPARRPLRAPRYQAARPCGAGLRRPAAARRRSLRRLPPRRRPPARRRRLPRPSEPPPPPAPYPSGLTADLLARPARTPERGRPAAAARRPIAAGRRPGARGADGPAVALDAPAGPPDALAAARPGAGRRLARRAPRRRAGGPPRRRALLPRRHPGRGRAPSAPALRPAVPDSISIRDGHVAEAPAAPRTPGEEVTARRRAAAGTVGGRPARRPGRAAPGSGWPWWTPSRWRCCSWRPWRWRPSGAAGSRRPRRSGRRNLLAALTGRRPEAGPFETSEIAERLLRAARAARRSSSCGGVVTSRARGPAGPVRVSVDVVRDGQVLAHLEGPGRRAARPRGARRGGGRRRRWPGSSRRRRPRPRRPPSRPGRRCPSWWPWPTPPPGLDGAAVRVTADVEGRR